MTADVACEECPRVGSDWLHLRDPIARSVESGKDWSWCFLDEVMFVLGPE